VGLWATAHSPDDTHGEILAHALSTCQKPQKSLSTPKLWQEPNPSIRFTTEIYAQISDNL